MATVLSQIKTMLELEITDPIYDDQLLMYTNSGLQYLINNKIPVILIDGTTEISAFTNLNPGDENLVLNWLHLYILQRFDRNLGAGTSDWLNSEQLDILYQLKTSYDCA